MDQWNYKEGPKTKHGYIEGTIYQAIHCQGSADPQIDVLRPCNPNGKIQISSYIPEVARPVNFVSIFCVFKNDPCSKILRFFYHTIYLRALKS